MKLASMQVNGQFHTGFCGELNGFIGKFSD